MSTDFARPGARDLACRLAKECIRGGDMNDAVEATAVLAVLFCKLAAKEDGAPFTDVFGELIQHAADIVDDGTVSIADYKGTD